MGLTGTMSIGKSFRFEAAHSLSGLPAGHKCARLHGHSYTVEVTLTADRLTGPGFVVDFGELAPLRSYLDSTFDHRILNEVLDVQPTAENLAAHVSAWFVENLEPGLPGRLAAVTVWETATSWAEFRVGC